MNCATCCANAYLAPHFRPDQLPVAPQWSIIALFVLVFVAGLATLGYMLRVVSRSASGGQSAAASLGG